ncbi:hypothetical protein SEUCBS139899_002562 [Sporothrix eucalyptigena]|uniref:Uncharacterized protein n=1 Tax=Sporothrix eucalyptigena TaxID=1812306 RepID=A0ABP0B407_9PEZI
MPRKRTAEGDTIFKKAGAGFQGNATLLLRMLAGLTTAKILQGVSDTTSVVFQLGSDLVCIPRVQLGNLVFVIRMLVEIDRNKRRLQWQTTTDGEGGDSENSENSEDLNSTLVDTDDSIDNISVVEQIQAVVDLRTQSDVLADLQVMHEMWLLQDGLEAIGGREVALRVEEEEYERV